MQITTLLAQGNWVFAHKSLIKKYGSDTAILVGYLCSQQEQYQDWFYCTYEKIEEDLGIKKYTIRKCMQQLMEDDILLSKREGLPSKVFYLLDNDSLIQVFENESTLEAQNHLGLALSKTKGLAVSKTKGHYILSKNILNNKKEKITKKNFTRTKKTIPPFYKKYSFFKDEFSHIWFKEYLPMKVKKKASINPERLSKQLDKIQTFSNNNYSKALTILENSVNAGWTDFYELKDKPTYNKPTFTNRTGVTETYGKGRVESF